MCMPEKNIKKQVLFNTPQSREIQRKHWYYHRGSAVENMSAYLLGVCAHMCVSHRCFYWITLSTVHFTSLSFTEFKLISDPQFMGNSKAPTNCNQFVCDFEWFTAKFGYFNQILAEWGQGETWRQGGSQEHTRMTPAEWHQIVVVEY